jgi:hypothetical protein
MSVFACGGSVRPYNLTISSVAVEIRTQLLPSTSPPALPQHQSEVVVVVVVMAAAVAVVAVSVVVAASRC